MRTLDVTGLPDEQTHRLEQLVEQLKQKAVENQEEDDVKLSDFTVQKSHIIGGMAYEDDIYHNSRSFFSKNAKIPDQN